ncbi:MAG: PAS domain S-box protein [Pseudomonadota bacterium]
MRKAFFTIIFCLGIAALFFIDQLQLAHRRSDENMELNAALSLYQMQLKNAIASRFIAVESLASLFVLHPKTSAAEFAQFAEFLLQHNPPIRAVQYADSNTRVIYVYPAVNNEITISNPMTLATDPKRGPFVRKAIQEKTTILQGPFELRQGGAGVVVRFPIFKEGVFIGLSIGVYDISGLANEALYGLNFSQFAFHLKDNQGNIFWSSGNRTDDFLQKELTVAGTIWIIAANWSEPLPPPIFSRVLIWFFGLGFLLTVSAFLQIAWRQEQRLKEKVEERTKDLSNSNQSLLIEIAERKYAEAALRQSEILLNTTQRLAKIGGWNWDVEQQTSFWTEETYRIHGFEPQTYVPGSSEYIDRSLVCYNPADRPIILAAFQRCVQQGDGYDLEIPFTSADGCRKWVRTTSAAIREEGRIVRVVGTIMDITERKQAQEKDQANFKFFESMDRINRAILGTNTLEEMMSDVLNVVLSIFDCDRASLVYPCDPAADSWQVPMERTRSAYPGVRSLGVEMPVSPDIAQTFRTMLASNGPVKFGPEYEHLLPSEVAHRFGIQSFIGMALHPKADKPWEFVLHQCSYSRVWTPEDELLFQEIGRRLTDALTSLSSYRNLLESEAKYRRIVDTASEGIWMLGEDLMTTFVNVRMAEMIGYQVEEMIGRSEIDFMFEEDAPDHHRRMDNRRCGMSEHYERRFRHRNGQTVWTQVSAVPILDAGKNFKGTFGMITDITERKQMEQTLSIRELEYRILVENIPDLIVRYDRNLRLIYVNPAWEKLSGLSAAEVIGVAQADIPRVPTPVVDDYARKLRQVMETGKSQATEFTWVNAHGVNLFLEYVMVPECDQHGEVASILAVGHDITEHKRAEEKLQESEEKYRSMMESMDDATYICSPDFRIEYMNPAMIQRTAGDSSNPFCHKVIHGLDGKCSWCVHKKVMKGESIKYEVVSPLDDKTYHISNVPIFHTDGSVSKLTVFRDVTEIKKLESLLRQAQKMEAIGNLAGGIAHDFNNILFPITGMSELLLEDLSPGSPEHDNVQMILQAGKRGSDLVKQILSFSRQAEYKIIPVQVQKVLNEVLKLSRSTIPANIEITQDISSDCGFVMADPTQIHQIALNLITNAFQAVENTDGKIDVRVQKVTLKGDEWKDDPVQPGHYALLSVSDNGCGIPPSIIDKIFDPYFTTKEKGKGTGLGLAVVYGIVREHEGHIKVYSEIGKGTTFNVYLPLMIKTPQTGSAETMKITETGTERVLLVDDELPVARLERLMLERLGYEVTERSNSTGALREFKENPGAFDIVITDMNMPGIPGEQLARELIAIRPDIPVVLCTGFSEKINKDSALAIGIKGFLMKPVSKADMAQMVRKVLDEAKGKKL